MGKITIALQEKVRYISPSPVRSWRMKLFLLGGLQLFAARLRDEGYRELTEALGAPEAQMDDGGPFTEPPPSQEKSDD